MNRNNAKTLANFTTVSFPSRVSALLQQEGLQLSIQQVIIQRCCESLPLWFSSPGTEPTFYQSTGDEGVFSVSNLFALLQHHAQEHMAALGVTETFSQTQTDVNSDSETSMEEQSSSPVVISASPLSHSSSFSSFNSFLLTPSALSFLKSHSPLLATLACLSACKGETVRTQSSGWSGYFRTARKEIVLDFEQISREADNLLKDFPILSSYLHTMAEPVLDTPLTADVDGSSAGLSSVLCGKPLMALILSGPQDEVTQALAAEAFQKAISSRDLTRALRLMELYGAGCSQQGVLRDQLLACAALEGEFCSHFTY